MSGSIEEEKGDERFSDLGNEVSDAINRAMRRGLECDQACSVVAQVAADYFRGTYGNNDLPGLASIITLSAGRPMPSDISRQ